MASYSTPHVLMDSDRVIITLSARISNLRGVFIKAFDYDGTPITDLIPVAVSSAGIPREYAASDFLSDGGLCIQFSRGNGITETSNIFFSHLSATYVVSPPVQINIQSAWCHGFGVLDNDDVGIILKTPPNGETQSAWINRYNLAGKPVDEPVAIDPDGLNYRSDITSNGFVALAYRVDNDNRVAGRIVRSDWHTQSEQFYLPFQTTSLQDDFGTVRSAPGLIADNSDAWFTWDNSLVPRQAHLAVLKPLLRGDMNNDRRVDNFDIDPFVQALTDPENFSLQYGIPQAAAAIIGDINADGVMNNFDIDPFVELLTGG